MLSAKVPPISTATSQLITTSARRHRFETINHVNSTPMFSHPDPSIKNESHHSCHSSRAMDRLTHAASRPHPQPPAVCSATARYKRARTRDDSAPASLGPHSPSSKVAGSQDTVSNPLSLGKCTCAGIHVRIRRACTERQGGQVLVKMPQH
jgi:hypothetical protein